MAMDDNTQVFALAMTLQHLLRALEKKGVMSQPETFSMLDDVLEEMRKGAFSPDAHKTIGLLYLPVEVQSIR